MPRRVDLYYWEFMPRAGALIVPSGKAYGFIVAMGNGSK
jgi:hypothetical protein